MDVTDYTWAREDDGEPAEASEETADNPVALTTNEARALAGRWAAVKDRATDADGRPLCQDCDGLGTRDTHPCPSCGTETLDLNGGDAPTCADCGAAYVDKCDSCDGWGYEQGLPEPLSAQEFADLLGWVRRRMERCKAEHEARLGTEKRCEIDIGGVKLKMSQAFFPADRETLAYDVMSELGWETLGSDPAGEHGLAWSLCEAAGWPA